MLHLLPSTLAACLFVLSGVYAQTVQNLWVFPSLPDNSSTVFEGSKYAITWDQDLYKVFAQYCSDCDVTNVDLWATGGLTDTSVQLVQAGVDVRETTALQWNVEIPQSDLTTIQWILRFVPSGDTPGSGVQEVSSPRFYIRPASSNPNAATTTSTAGPTSTSAPSSTSDASSDGLSTGAKAGIGVGVAIGVLLIIAAVIAGIIISRRRQSSGPQRSPTLAAEQAAALNGSGGGPPEYEHKDAPYSDVAAGDRSITKISSTAAPVGPQELTASPIQASSGPHELEHRIPVGELDGTSYQSRPAELPSDTTRSS